MGYANPGDIAAVERAGALVAEVSDRIPGQTVADPWPTLDAAGSHGPFGDFTQAAAGYTEADPVGILFCCLAEFGGYVGPSPHMNAGNVRHAVNLFGVLVGNKHKGTGFAGADRLVQVAAPEFRRTRFVGGFNSGEALADTSPPTTAPDPTPASNPSSGGFSPPPPGGFHPVGAYRTRGTEPASTHARSASVVVDDHHVAIVAQITAEELRARLPVLDLHSGFANRFLWVAVRGGLQPNGGNVPDEIVQPAAGRVSRAADRPPPGATHFEHQGARAVGTGLPGDSRRRPGRSGRGSKLVEVTPKRNASPCFTPSPTTPPR